MMGPENAYRLLGLDMDRAAEISIDDIRTAYKRRAILVHPDKPHGSEKAFGLMCEAYRALAKLHTQIADVPMDVEQAQERVATIQSTIPPTTCYKGGRFDPILFNEAFQREDTPYDRGYDAFTRTNEHRPDTIAPLSERPTDLPSSTHLIKYTAPRALNGFGCSDLATMDDGEKISDFSGENLSAKRLQFTDVQLAHTTQKIADESYADDRMNFNSVDDLNAYRSSQLDRIAYKEEFLK